MKHKKRLNKKKAILTFFMIPLLFVCIFSYQIWTIFLNHQNESEYLVIKEDKNPDYPGIGQCQGNKQMGYLTTFQTSQNKVYKEYKQNLYPWKDHPYWQSTMENDGCGITSFSIILSGYQIHQTPENLRKKYFPVLNGSDIAREFNYFGIANSDFYYDDTHLSKSSLYNHLKTGRPILICVWNQKKENRWTTSSHYMVLLAGTENKVYISNPNGGSYDSKSSGWYNYEEIVPYLAKALYIYQ